MKHQNPRKKMSNSEFSIKANQIHNGNYDYSCSEYINYFEKIEIFCKQCSTTFFQTPSNHLAGRGCKNCQINKQRLNTNDFIKTALKIHGNNYDYSQTEYLNAKTKINIKCNKCNNVFSQLPRGHIYEKNGCPKCRQSHGEKKIALLLDFLGLIYEREKKFNDCFGTDNKTPLRFDFYLPKFNICIEYDGKQHSDVNSKYWNESIKINDLKKDEYCKEKNIRLKRIDYKEFDSIEQIVKSFLI